MEYFDIKADDKKEIASVSLICKYVLKSDSRFKVHFTAHLN